MSSGSNPAAIKAGTVSRKFVAVPKMLDKAELAWAGDVMVAVGTVASSPQLRRKPLVPDSCHLPVGSRQYCQPGLFAPVQLGNEQQPEQEAAAAAKSSA